MRSRHFSGQGKTYRLAEGRLAKREADAVVEALDRLLGLAVGLDRALGLLGRGRAAVLVEVERRDNGERRVERELDGSEQVLLGRAASNRARRGVRIAQSMTRVRPPCCARRQTHRLSDRAATVSWGKGLPG